MGNSENRRVSLAGITVFVLVVLVAFGAGAYALRSYDAANAQSGTVASQAATIAQLTAGQTELAAENAALSSRLNTCIASAERYKSYTAENKATMQKVSDKWGINYSVPLKGVFASLAAAATQLECS